MLNLLLLAVAAPGFAQSSDDLVLETYLDGRFEPAARVRPGQVIVLPFQTRSIRQPRVGTGPRGVGLRIAAPGGDGAVRVSDVRVRAVPHPVGSRVVLTASGGLRLLEDLRLPVVDPRGELAPYLARQDDVEAYCDPDDWAEVQLPTVVTERTRLVGWQGLFDPWKVWIEKPEHADGGFPGAWVDHAAWAEVRRIEESELVQLELRGSALRPTTPDWEWSTAPTAPMPRPLWRSARENRPPVGNVDGWERLFDSPPEGVEFEGGGALELWFRTPAELDDDSTWTVLFSASFSGRTGTGTSTRRPTVGLFTQSLDDKVLPGPFLHFEGPDEQLDIRPTMGPGIAWGDVDGDGWTDLYAVQGGGRPEHPTPTNRLYRNRGGQDFEDFTEASGTGDTGAGMGALFFDALGDGDLDLYVANYGPDVLYQNGGTGRFSNATESAGISGDRWSAGLCAGDPDRDGDLDLYVTSYLLYDEEAAPPEDAAGRYQRDDPVGMLPFAFPGDRNVFWRNESTSNEIRFVDVTAELGLEDVEGRGMQPVFWDFDRDGWEDLYVANDVSYNKLWRNNGDGTFEDVSFVTGMDDPRGGMGLAIADVEQDGDEDLFLTNWELDANGLYVNNLSHTSQRHRVASFRDQIVRSGLGPASVGATSWGAELFDADLDGVLDLYVANGYTSPDYVSTGICVGQPDQFFLGVGGGRFEEASGELPQLLRPLPSRAAAACDWDRDGDVDIAVTANNAALRLFTNTTIGGAVRTPDGRWLGVRLRAAGKNTHAIGAEVTIRSGDQLWRRSLRAGQSYLVGNPPELHFGLGEIDAIDELVVRWPSGAETKHAVDALDRWMEIAEPR